jgi:hypothetical protein
VGDGTAVKLYMNPGKNVGSKISAIRTRGAELAGQDNFTVMLSGDTLDHGGIKDGVAAKVANFLPFLVLKAFAIEERDKPKDSYDVIWAISAYKDGPQSVVEEVAKSPILGRNDVASAVGYLHKTFASIDHSGPADMPSLNNPAAAKKSELLCADTRYAEELWEKGEEMVGESF